MKGKKRVFLSKLVGRKEKETEMLTRQTMFLLMPTERVTYVPLGPFHVLELVSLMGP